MALQPSHSCDFSLLDQLQFGKNGLFMRVPDAAARIVYLGCQKTYLVLKAGWEAARRGQHAHIGMASMVLDSSPAHLRCDVAFWCAWTGSP